MPYARAAVVHLNFRAESTFPVPVCTVPSSMERTSQCNKVDVVRPYATYRLNLFLLRGRGRGHEALVCVVAHEALVCVVGHVLRSSFSKKRLF